MPHTGNLKELVEGRVLPLLEGLSQTRHFALCRARIISHLAEEEPDTRKVNVSNSIQQRQGQNWDLNLVHLLKWAKFSL